jgi:hypothetical protein
LQKESTQCASVAPSHDAGSSSSLAMNPTWGAAEARQGGVGRGAPARPLPWPGRAPRGADLPGEMHLAAPGAHTCAHGGPAHLQVGCDRRPGRRQRCDPGLVMADLRAAAAGGSSSCGQQQAAAAAAAAAAGSSGHAIVNGAAPLKGQGAGDLRRRAAWTPAPLPPARPAGNQPAQQPALGQARTPAP